MSYRVVIHPDLASTCKKLRAKSPARYEHLKKKIRFLVDNPESGKPLHPPLKGQWRVHLGKYWSSMPAIRVDHKLIRTGPYGLVRHPIYTVILFGVAGTAIIIGEPLGLIAFFLILVVYLWKIRMEEKYLQEEFGEDYARYKKEVPALIPLLV